MSVHLTFDIDWAPDWSIEEVLELLDSQGVKGTFFCTHVTDLNKEIVSRGHNLGIHPNFLPGTTQGSSNLEIVQYLLDIAPHASSMRSHALVQSTPLLHEIFSCFGQLKYDFSLLTPGTPLFRFIQWNFDNVAFKRINYQWEDDACFFDKNYDWTSIEINNPFFVMDFHPIHVSLNSRDLEGYKSFKNSLGTMPMINSTPSDCASYINHLIGTRDALEYTLKNQHCISFEELLCELALLEEASP